jgi:quercetin dioxygenase-like cupin family protein
VNYDELAQRVYSALCEMGRGQVCVDGYKVRMHPGDWREVRLTMPLWHGAGSAADDLARILGVPVETDTGVAPGRIVLRREVEA